MPGCDSCSEPVDWRHEDRGGGEHSFSPHERYKKWPYWQELDHHWKPEKCLASYGRDGEVIAFPLSLVIMLLAPKMRDAVCDIYSFNVNVLGSRSPWL